MIAKVTLLETSRSVLFHTSPLTDITRILTSGTRTV